VTGDVHNNNSLYDMNNYLQVNGQKTHSPKIETPIIDLDLFENEAQKVRQYELNYVKCFNENDGPYSGVWYVEGYAVLYKNTVINGTIAAKYYVIFLGDNITANATPNNYPVLVGGFGGYCIYNNHKINGLIFSNHYSYFYGDNFDITGSISSGTYIFLYASNINITYDGKYLINPVSVSFPEGGND